MASRAEKEAMHRGLRPSEVIRDDEQEKEYDMPPKGKSFADKAEAEMDKAVAEKKKKKPLPPMMLKKGGKIDGCAIRGKTRGRMV